MLTKLLSGTPLTFAESRQHFNNIMAGTKTDVEITATLLALKFRGETAAEIAGAASALKAAAKKIPPSNTLFTDACGTGGDGHHTVNISTAAALVAASLGVSMMKHGNRSVSSRCGSADVLEACGFNIHLSAEQSLQICNELNFAFLFAPDYHNAVQHVMPVRKTLATRTIFNLLGPLINPASPSIQLLGVYSPTLCKPLAETLQMLGCKEAMVIHGAGLDEIAIHGETVGFHLKNNRISPIHIQPQQFGFSGHKISDLKGGSIEENQTWLFNVLKGNASNAHIHSIALNTAALLFLNKKAPSLKDGFSQVVDHLKAGKAAQHFNVLIEASHDFR
jgi:anthranilate phosphoribosyltransferase